MLPPETERVWNYLKGQPALAGFILAGGSALALTLRHRLSEDLDFIFPETRLPRQRLDALRRQASSDGFDFQPNDDEAASQDFAQSGMDLRDYQQDFLVNDKTKVSFFAPDQAQAKIFGERNPASVRVASLSELFKSKALVSAVRSKTRDWFDLFLLMRDHGFTIWDYRAAFDEAGNRTQSDVGLSRLCGGVPQRDDEGYTHLLPHPPTLEEMKKFFIEQRTHLEIEASAAAARNPSRKN